MSTATEQKQVLEMLSEGKITPDEAQRLLERLSRPGSSGSRDDRSATDRVSRETSGATATTALVLAGSDQNDNGGKPTKRSLRWLRVVVDGNDGEKVNIRIPIQLLRAGIKLSAVVPSHARERMKEEGLDLSHLSQLDGEELIQALEDLTVDVDSGSGEKVRIYCE